LISTRSSVFTKIVSCNYLEFDWSTNKGFLQKTWSESKRFACSCVQEVLERQECSSEVITTDAYLDNTFFWSVVLERWSLTSDKIFTLALTNNFT
jgi:hypothetical protein